MLQSLGETNGYGLRTVDGELGKIKDFYFDDRGWHIRYLVADTGTWLSGRKVLLAPESLGRPDAEEEVVPVNLTREQIEGAPSIREDEPVSEQHERELVAWYGWGPYWGGGPALTGGVVPVPIQRGGVVEVPKEPAGDDHLRSCHEVAGYHIAAADGDKVGHVEDFLADTESWAIRYLLVDTRNWLPGRKVLVAPAWAQSVNWEARVLHVRMTGEEIRQSPEYDASSPVDREYEEALHDHYGRPKYWE